MREVVGELGGATGLEATVDIRPNGDRKDGIGTVTQSHAARIDVAGTIGSEQHSRTRLIR